MPDEPSAIVAASRDTTRHPRNADGKYTAPNDSSVQAAKSALIAVWHADAFAGHSTIPENCQYCNESAEIAYAAMEPLIRRQVAEEIAAELLARGRDPHQNLAWMYPDQAAAIAREIGERHA